MGGAIISLAAYAYISLTKFIREYKEELLADYGGFVTVPNQNQSTAVKFIRVWC